MKLRGAPRIGHAALGGDDVAGDPKDRTEIAVTRGNHATKVRSVFRIVEETDHLFGNRTFASKLRKKASADLRAIQDAE